MPVRVLVDSDGHRITPDSENELLRALTAMDSDARASGKPQIATLFADRDDIQTATLAIGLGADDSVLVYADNRRDTEDCFSKGPRTDDTTEVSFRYGTGHGEFYGWMLIPTTTAFTAAREFFRTGAKPTAVEWGDI